MTEATIDSITADIRHLCGDEKANDVALACALLIAQIICSVATDHDDAMSKVATVHAALLEAVNHQFGIRPQ